MDNKVLEKIRIVDFSWQYTGPLTTRFLANFGAQVIKIESIEKPDGCRSYSPYKDSKPGVNRSTIFANYNAGKLSVAINLNKPKGSEMARKLVAISDIVVESFRPGVMKRLGLGYEELSKIKPDLIYISMSMQGQTGPLSKQLTLGMFFQGAVGITHMTGWPDRPPAGVPLAYPDYITPWYMVFAAMAALDYRRRTGKGLYLDVSQLETSLQFLAPALLDYTVNGRIQTRNGNRSSVAPHGAYQCKGEDRWCTIAVSTDRQWGAFRKAIGQPGWAMETRFEAAAGRLNHEAELDKYIEAWTRQYTAEEVMRLLQAAGVPAGVVQNGQDIMNDPQLEHRQHFRRLEHTEIGEHLCEMPPARFSDTPPEFGSPFPSLGEHNELVCSKILGLSDQEFSELIAEGVLA